MSSVYIFVLAARDNDRTMVICDTIDKAIILIQKFALNYRNGRINNIGGNIIEIKEGENDEY